MKKAFSLIELLISLIIISLITTAFTPILSKKLRKTDIALGQTGVITYKSETFYEDSEWEVPKGVKKIKVTSIAGGGGGGGSTYSFVDESKLEEMSSSPVLKRVTKYGDIPSINNAIWNFLSSGTYNLSAVIPPDTHKTPNLPSECKNVGIDKWTVVSTNTSVAQGAKIPSFSNGTNFTISYVSICGAGGGAAHSQNGVSRSSGGSGGYIGNYALDLSANASNLTFKIGEAGGLPGTTIGYAAGGKGGFGANYGLDGAPGSSRVIGNCGITGGGGGGGSSAILNAANQIILEAPGGGGAGGSAGDAGSNCGARGGVGGTGGGTNPGTGGGAGWCSGPYSCHGGANSTSFTSGGGSRGPISGDGGTGGGGKGANLSKVFSGSNCAGSMPGAIQLIYSVEGISKGLKCDYGTIVTNGAGGSSGQVVQEEINTKPGSKIKITIGKGGTSNPQKILEKTIQGQNGNNGTDSYITIDEKIYALSKGGLGGQAGTLNGHGIALSHDETIKNYAKAQDGNQNHGGNGGSITQALCSLFDPIRGLGGCGGNIPSGTCANFALTPTGKSAAINGGGGGGGGAVSSSSAYEGGNGANGIVIIEYN